MIEDDWVPIYSFCPYVENLCMGIKCLPNEVTDDDIGMLRECLDDRVEELKLKKLGELI